MSSTDNDNDNDNPQKDANNSPNKSNQTNPSNFPDGYENPTPKQLYEYVRATMEKTEPSPPAPVQEETPAPAVKLPNNGYSERTCAGCGAENGEDGGALRQCARCKGRKYCGRACQ
ncbi:hypothetical protein MBLNU13_g00131t1 [Cladosporium sp. NU13]